MPQHRGVGDQGETERPVDLVIEVTAPDVTLVGEEQIAASGVPALALVQLPSYAFIRRALAATVGLAAIANGAWRFSSQPPVRQ